MTTGFWTPVKVGILTIAAVAALIIALGQLTGETLRDHESYLVYAIFDDATGLRKRSRVQIAGIEVGKIERIDLVGHKAKITLRVHEDVVLYSNARLTKRAEGLIGDMSIDIFPGSERFPVLPPGGEIRQVVSRGPIEQVFDILADVTSDIQGVTASMQQVFGDETAEAIQKVVLDLARLSESIAESVEASSRRVEGILVVLEAISTEVYDVTRGERQTVSSILANVEQVSTQMRDVLTAVQAIIGDSEDELTEGVADLRRTLGRLNEALDQVGTITGHVGEVTDRVARGEGTIGRLMVDDGLIRSIEETVAEASDIVDRFVRLQTEVDVGSEIHFRSGRARTTAEVRLIPRPDKWYSFGVVDPAHPLIERVDETELVDGVPVTTETWSARRTWQINAQLARRWALPGVSVTGRVGVFEGSGGVGGDLGLARDRLSLSFDAFQFLTADRSYPRLRAYASWTLLQHLYVTGGVDDMLNASVSLPPGLPDRPARDVFLGAGIFFTDDDLKSLLTTVGIPTP